MSTIRLRVFRIGVAMLLLSSCALISQDLVERAIVTVETVPSSEFSFSRVEVSRKGTMIIISGSLRHRHGRTRQDIPGHVDIEVTGKDGSRIASATVPYRPWHPGWTMFFRFEAAMTVTDGSKVRIAHHDPSERVHETQD